MLLGTTVQAMAATAPDSVFVVKDGRIVSAYEIGKDVDNITFLHKTVLTGNCVRIGDETVEMKSAVVTYKGSYAYIYSISLRQQGSPLWSRLLKAVTFRWRLPPDCSERMYI